MEYALIVLLQSLGIYFHVMQKIVSLGDKYPNETPKGIWKIFWKEDWDTLAISGGIVVLNLVGHYIVFVRLEMVLKPEWYWQISPYLASLIGGYLGQRYIYKFFGSAERFLDKKHEQFIDRN